MQEDLDLLRGFLIISNDLLAHFAKGLFAQSAEHQAILRFRRLLSNYPTIFLHHA